MRKWRLVDLRRSDLVIEAASMAEIGSFREVIVMMN